MQLIRLFSSLFPTLDEAQLEVALIWRIPSYLSAISNTSVEWINKNIVWELCGVNGLI